MKDERNYHGAVDKSFSKQRICIVDTNTFFVRKIGPVHIAELGLTAGSRQVAGEIQLNLGIFKNHCTSKI